MPDGIVVAPGATFYPRLEWPTGSLVGTIGIRITKDSDASVALARQTTGITEPFPGQYIAAITAPSTAGEYTILWDERSTAVGHTAVEDLLVTSSAATPATGTDLCSLSDVKAYLGRSDTVFDSVLSSLITRFSRRIEEWAQREFADHGTATRTFRVDGSLVDLAPYEPTGR